MPEPRPYEPTIGQPEPGSNAAGFLVWAEHAGRATIARLLLNTLLAVDNSVELGHVIDLLSRNRHMLASWSAAGDEVFGLADLAASLAGQEHIAVLGDRLPLAIPAKRRLHVSVASHYLQLALISRPPIDPAVTSVAYDGLRIWLLVEALGRAVQGNRHDSLLRIAADGLRLASESPAHSQLPDPTPTWSSTVAALRPRHEALARLRLYLIWRTRDLLDSKSAYPPGSAHRKFLDAVGAIARGESSPAAPLGMVLPPNPLHDWVRPIIDAFPLPPTSWELGWTDSPAPVAGEGDDDAAADEEVEAAVDPEATRARQERQARYVYLVSAARARFVSWRWDTANPREQVALGKKIAETYRTGDFRAVATAAFTDIAVHAGRSLNTVTRLVVGSENPQPDDWCLVLEPNGSFLTRPPPRRARHEAIRARIDPVIRPEATEIRLQLPSGCHKVLCSLARHFGQRSAQRLIDLWPDLTRTPAQAFADWLKDDPVLHRLTPGMLGPVAMSQVYTQSGDWLVARMLCAPPNSGLPAAASYAAYTAEEVTTALAAWFAGPAATNAAGSLIDAADAHYKRGFSRLAAVIEAAAGIDDLLHHNLCTLYIDAALRAGTGSRPADGVWLWANIDFQVGFAFVDDKTGIDDSTARWVALPKRLRGLLRGFLKQHLPGFIARLRSTFGQAADNAIAVLEAGPAYITLTPAGPAAELLGRRHRLLHPDLAVESPLPLNAFRHRARTVWRRHGCDHEVIDSFLGHSDGATRTHGDFSARTWASDFRRALRSINAAYDTLEIDAPALWPDERPATARAEVAAEPARPDRTAGDNRDHSASVRWRRLLAAARLVLAKLTMQAIADEPAAADRLVHACARMPVRELLAILPTWSEQQVTAVISSLTTTSNGMPAPNARPCLRYLGRLADRCWTQQRQPFRLRRRLFRGLATEAPIFTSAGIGARHRHRQWLTAFATCVEASNRKALSAQEASTLLATSLLLESRVTDMKVLEDAVRGRLRPVRYEHRWFVEWWADEEAPAHGHGVLRLRVRDEAASWLAVVQHAQTLHHSVQSQASKIIRPLLQAAGVQLPCPLEQALKHLAGTIEALTFMQLPGNVAAARAGRLLTASRSWPDWTRTRDGSFVTLDPPLPEPDETRPNVAGGSLSTSTVRGLDSRRAAEDFCNALRAVFAEHRVGGGYKPIDAPVRRDLRRAFEAQCRKHERSVSSAMQALGQWTSWLLDRKLHGQQLALSSVARYFSALAPRFEAVAHDVDLLSLDTEGVTELYADVLQIRNVDRPSYVFSRLREFDRFCASTPTLPRPDWSELGVVDVGIGISPGYIDEPTYLRLLEQFDALGDADLARKCRLMALFGYRFGLRAAEAAWLRVKDVVGDGPDLHVNVERTAMRDVKTDHGRRTLPLLFLLEKRESEFLQSTLDQARERSRTMPDALLLADPGNPNECIDTARIARHVARALKAVSGNDALGDHHLRHSFACEISRALECQSDQLGAAQALAAQRVRWLLLDEDRPTRRAPWAMATILGHGHPAQAFRSYIHFLNERADELIFGRHEPQAPSGMAAPEGAVDLDAQPRRLPVQAAPVAPPTVAVTAATLLLTIRMLAGGARPSAVAKSLHLDEAVLLEADSTLADISDRLADTNPAGSSSLHPKLRSSGLLAHMNVSREAGFAALLDAALTRSPMPEGTVGLIDGAHLAGMVSRRGQIAVWREDQIVLLMSVVQALQVPREQLSLGYLDSLDAGVANLAMSAGLMASGDAPPNPVASTTAPFPVLRRSRRRLEPSYLKNPRRFFPERVALLLAGQAHGGLRNNYDLILAALCMWLYWKLRRRDNAK